MLKVIQLVSDRAGILKARLSICLQSLILNHSILLFLRFLLSPSKIKIQRLSGVKGSMWKTNDLEEKVLALL